MKREREDLQEVEEKNKRKICADELRISSARVACVRIQSEDALVAPGSLVLPASELTEKAVLSTENAVDGGLASCCSSNGSSDVTKGSSKFLDLDDCVEETATSNRSDSEFKKSRERILSSELIVELNKLESTVAMPQNPKLHRRSMAEKMPTEADIDDFFAVAEKDLLKRAAQKYNFDFVKEKPLEGRYEWIRE